MSRGDLLQLGLSFGAVPLAEPAAGVERASCRQLRGRRHVALEDDALALVLSPQTSQP